MKEIYNRKQFIENETDALDSYVNDYTWRESMWQLSYCPTRKTYMKRNTAMLTKRFWTSQKSVIEYLNQVYWADPDLYTESVKKLIHNKKELRKVAKEIINNI